MNAKHAAAMLLAALLLSSCVHRGFDIDEGRYGYVDVVFDWRNDPDADPRSMALCMYPLAGGEALRYDFSGRDGGVITIAPGEYAAICANSDRRGVAYDETGDFGRFLISTEQLSRVPLGGGMSISVADLPRAPCTEGQPVYENPPMMWSSSETGFNVTVGAGGRPGVEVDRQTLYMYPVPIVDTYMVTVKNISNAGNIKALSGTLSDMSSGYLCGEQEDTDDAVMLPFVLATDPGAKRAEGTFLTFGHCPDGRRTHSLALYAVLTDDTKYFWVFDVSDQAHNPPDENGIYHIVVEFLDIPELGGESNMGASVTDWNSNDIYVKL